MPVWLACESPAGSPWECGLTEDPGLTLSSIRLQLGGLMGGGSYLFAATHGFVVRFRHFLCFFHMPFFLVVTQSGHHQFLFSQTICLL
jgi:hypothetical protein